MSDTATTYPRTEIEETYSVLRDFLAWSKGRPDRRARQEDYVAVWHACERMRAITIERAIRRAVATTGPRPRGTQ